MSDDRRGSGGDEERRDEEAAETAENAGRSGAVSREKADAGQGGGAESGPGDKDKLVHLRPPRPCPTCGKPSARKTFPFCSARCADVDLNRWLSGQFVIPGRSLTDTDEDEADGFGAPVNENANTSGKTGRERE